MAHDQRVVPSVSKPGEDREEHEARGQDTELGLRHPAGGDEEPGDAEQLG